MAKQLKNKGGRPKEKVEDKIDLIQVEKLAGLGLTDEEIGSFLGVCEMTINRWKVDEGFLLALKRGKLKADARVVESLYKRACGYKYVEKTFEAVKDVHGVLSTRFEKVKVVTKQVEPNVTAGIYWLNNRRKQDWRTVKDGAEAPGDKPQSDKIDMIIADAEKRAREGVGTCH